MGFEGGFELREGVNISDVRWEWVPEFGSRAAESSAPHGGEPGRGDSEVDGRGGSEGAGGGGSVKEVRQVGRGKVVDGFKGMTENFEVDTEVDWKPVELF